MVYALVMAFSARRYLGAMRIQQICSKLSLDVNALKIFTLSNVIIYY